MRRLLCVLSLLAAMAGQATEVVGYFWEYPADKTNGLQFVVYHRSGTNQFRVVAMVPASEVAKRHGPTNVYEICLSLDDGNHELAVTAVRAGTPSAQSEPTQVQVGGETPQPPEHFLIMELLEATNAAGPWEVVTTIRQRQLLKPARFYSLRTKMEEVSPLVSVPSGAPSSSNSATPPPLPR